jgi:superfamily II RNA helicase
VTDPATFAKSYPSLLGDFQRTAVEAPILVAAPTGSGKTVAGRR